MITDFWDQGRFSDLNPMLLTDSASPELRRELGAIHPSGWAVPWDQKASAAIR